MRKMTALAAAAALCTLPAAADAHRGHRAVGPAAQACQAERQANPAAFQAKYANANGRRAFRRCVRRHVQQAVATCRSERQANPAAFRTKYANRNGRHAFRRCVRQHEAQPVS